MRTARLESRALSKRVGRGDMDCLDRQITTSRKTSEAWGTRSCFRGRLTARLKLYPSRLGCLLKKVKGSGQECPLYMGMFGFFPFGNRSRFFFQFSCLSLFISVESKHRAAFASSFRMPPFLSEAG